MAGISFADLIPKKTATEAPKGQISFDDLVPRNDSGQPLKRVVIDTNPDFKDRFAGEPAPPAPDKGALNAAFRGVGSGLTFNFNDEIAGLDAAGGEKTLLEQFVLERLIPGYGLMKGGAKYLSGDEDAAKRYALRKGYENKEDATAYDQHPVANIAGNLAGGVATGLVVPGGGIARGATWLQRLGQGAKVGGGFGALGGIGAGEGIEDRTTGGVLGGLVGGVLGGATGAAFRGGPRAPVGGNTGREVAEAAENIGVNVPRGILSDNPDVQAMTYAAQQLPLVGGRVTSALNGARTGIEDAVNRGAANLSPVGFDRAATGAAVRSSVERGIERTDARANGAYARLRNQIEGGGNAVSEVSSDVLTPLHRVVESRIAAGESGVPIDGLTKAVDLLTRPEGASFNGLQRARTEVGKAIAWDKRNEGFIGGDLKQAYNALSDAMERAVRQTARGNPDDATAALARANDIFGRVTERNRELQRFLAHGSDERIVDRIVSYGSDKANRGNIAQMNTIRRSMDQGEWNSVAAQAMQRMGQNARNEFSTDIFARNFQNLAPAAREMLFGRSGTATRQYIEDIATVTRRMNEAGQFRNTSNTGRATLLGAGLAGASTAWNDPFEATKSALGFAGVSVPVAMILSRPASAASMARWSGAYRNLISRPGTAALASFNAASRNFAHTLGEMSGVKIDPTAFLRAIPRQPTEEK